MKSQPSYDTRDPTEFWAFPTFVDPTFALPEMTFGLIKSHAVRKGLVGVVLDRVLAVELIVLMAGATRLSGEQIVALYGQHTHKPYWRGLLDSVSGPVVPMLLAGRNAVETWRTLLGATDSAWADIGTLRGDFGNKDLVAENVAHGSDSLAAAKREIALFFPKIILRRW
jgi:nucleoside-diphosphate kinase